MKKLITIMALAVIGTSPTHAEHYSDFAWTSDKDNNRCLLHRLYGNSYGWRNEHMTFFYMCGSQNDIWCCDQNMTNNRHKQIRFHGDMIQIFKQTSHGPSYRSEYFFCCDGKWNQQGRWVFTTVPKFSTTTEKIIELPGGGTCSYTETVDICGNVTPPCTVPDNCPEGTHLRNKECVPLCVGDDMAFESPTSNKCIKCEKSLYRGISEDGTCTQCNSSNQIFDRRATACKKKSEFTQYSGQAFKKCYACSSPSIFRDCVKIFSLPTGSTEFKLDNTYNDVVKDCLIPQDQLPK